MLPSAPVARPKPSRPTPVSPPASRFRRRQRKDGRGTTANVRAGLLIFLTAFAGLALFRSGDLLSTTYDLPPGETSEAVIALAETWHGWMETIGTAQAGEAVVETVGALASGELFIRDETDEGVDNE